MRWVKGHKMDHFCRRCKCMTPDIRRIRQFLPAFVSLDTCYYFSSKKLNWFSFLLNAFCTLIIQSFLRFPSIRRIRGANPWSQQKSLDLEIFLETLKALLKYVKHGILSVWLWSARQEDRAKLYEFLCHVTPIVIFSFN